MYIYLPSCNFTAALPEVSKKIKNYFSEQEQVKVAGCCRPTQKKLTAEDTILSMCFTCSAITNEVSPHVNEESIWEYLLTDEAFPWPDYHGEKMTLQDCWRARNKPEVLEAVRACMRKMNIEIIELEENLENTTFDGVWRFNPVLKKNMEIAPVYFKEVQAHGLELLQEEEQKQRMEEWCSQYTTDRVVTYCTACLKGAQLGGVHAIHLMELLTARL